jgi:hypothetical protein
MCPAIRPFNQDGPIVSLVAILVGNRDHQTQLWKEAIQVWLQLAQWFLRRRFLCEFPIGSYVKLSSAVWAILLQPNFGGMVLGWSPSNIVSGILDLAATAELNLT